MSAPELPAAGATGAGERTDPRTPDASGTVLTIPEAVERYEVSAGTLRRKLTEGAIPGAHKAPSAKGDAWQLPVVALEALGYRHRRPLTVEPGPPPPSAPEVLALTALVDRLTAILENDRRALTAAEVDRTDAATRAATAEARLEGTAEELARARAEADQLRATLAAGRRRWWHRG